MPWLMPLLTRTLAQQHAHALLLHGPQGVGQFELGLMLAQAWLCEVQPSAQGGPINSTPVVACGTCASCRLVQAHTHPDLLVLLPEALQLALGWFAEDEAAPASERTSKAKPSKEIKVEAVRKVVSFAQITSSRGRGKVVLLYPAERMNTIAANTVLKTLEEPPGNTRFVLSCAAPEALLPTIRSRCQAVVLTLPPTEQALAWLTEQGVASPAVMLAATGGQPQRALEWSQQGVDAQLWTRLPELILQGDAGALAAWPLPRVVDALQKLCIDSACVAHGAAPRYFAANTLQTPSQSLTSQSLTSQSPALRNTALSDWMRELNRVARHVEHPWNAGLMIESLVQQGKRALLHSRR
jgi:DNA polymerase III subunit delta'